VTVSAGGLSYSVPVTVLGGSVQQPCGTVPLSPSRFKHAPNVSSAPTPPPPAPAPTPAPAPVAPVPPPPPPVAPTATPPPAPRPVPAKPPAPAPFLAPVTPIATALLVTPPPPPNAFARPTPPGGATVRVFEEEKEEEGAAEHSQAFARYEPAAHVGVNGQGGGGLFGPFVLGAAILVAACGASVGLGRRRRGRPVWARSRAYGARTAPVLAVEQHPYQQPPHRHSAQLPRPPASSYGELRRTR
jgi:hypothetical protein